MGEAGVWRSVPPAQHPGLVFSGPVAAGQKGSCNHKSFRRPPVTVSRYRVFHLPGVCLMTLLVPLEDESPGQYRVGTG